MCENQLELLKEAQRLRDLGWSYTRIGKEVGFSQTTIMRWLNPTYHQRRLQEVRDIYSKNPEKSKKRVRKWQKDNLEKNRETKRKWNTLNHIKVKEQNRKWQKDNPGKVKKMTASRRANKRAASVPLTTSEQSQMMSMYKNCPDGCEVDHIIPLSRGGLHHPLNLQYLSTFDNRSKKNNIRQEDIELFQYRLVNETTDTDPMTFMDLLESLYLTNS